MNMNKHSVVFFIVLLVAVITASCGNKHVDMLLLHVDSVANMILILVNVKL